MAYHRCPRHGLMSNIPCENTLISGSCCPKPVCSACVDCYDELCIKHNVSRNINTHSFCGDCIISFFGGKHHLVTPNDKPLVIPLSDPMISLKPMSKSVIDLTISSSNSNDSLEDIDQNIGSCIITKPMLKDSVVRIEKYIDTSTSNDKTGHINNHTVASDITKPMGKNTTARLDNDYDVDVDSDNESESDQQKTPSLQYLGMSSLPHKRNKAEMEDLNLSQQHE